MKFLVFSVVTFIFSLTNAQNYQNVNANKFKTLIVSQKGILLDVRTEQEHSRGHIEGATLISTNDQKFVEKTGLLNKENPIYIYCLTGSRSRAVANYLSQNGFKKVFNLQRGIIEWNQMGFPIIQSSVTIASKNKSYSNSEFKSVILSNKLVLVDFHAPWCAPCKKMAPDIDKLKKDYTGKAVVEKVDVEVNQQIQKSYSVNSIPGLVLFKNGKEIWRHQGVLTYNELTEIINKNL